ncbi:hypothetical protein BHM03_00058864, partial [Ensete ventricosum]
PSELRRSEPHPNWSAGDDFLLKLPPLAPERLQLSPHLLNFALQLFPPTLSGHDQLLADSCLQHLIRSPKSQDLLMLALNQSACVIDPIDKGVGELRHNGGEVLIRPRSVFNLIKFPHGVPPLGDPLEFHHPFALVDKGPCGVP